eukprot:g4022.t1
MRRNLEVIGVEGGGTSTRALRIRATVVVQQEVQVQQAVQQSGGLATAVIESWNVEDSVEAALGTNPWVLPGKVGEVERRVREVTQHWGLAAERVAAMGLTMSGFGGRTEASQLEEGLKDCAQDVCVSGDATGPWHSISTNAAVVLIAGTGSLAMAFFQPDGRAHSWRAGGHGHIVGDEGSAYWIAREAVRAVLQGKDHIHEHEVLRLEEAILSHFGAKNLREVILQIHAEDGKRILSSFARTVSRLAEEQNDVCCRHILKRAGEELGQLLFATLPEFERHQCEQIDVVLVGSVWKSFHLMRSGMIERLHQLCDKLAHAPVMRLGRLTATAAHGAAWHALKTHLAREKILLATLPPSLGLFQTFCSIDCSKQRGESASG